MSVYKPSKVSTIFPYPLKLLTIFINFPETSWKPSRLCVWFFLNPLRILKNFPKVFLCSFWLQTSFLSKTFWIYKNFLVSNAITLFTLFCLCSTSTNFPIRFFSGQNVLLIPKNRTRRKKCHCMAILGGSDLTRSLHNLRERVFWIVTNTQTDTQTEMATLWLNRSSWADSVKFKSWVIYILIKWDIQSWLRSSKVEVIQKSVDEKFS